MPSCNSPSKLPKPSPAADSCVGDCPNKKEPTKRYTIEVIVQTRAGDIPLEGLPVLIDDGEFGKTDVDGKSPTSPPRSKSTASIEVRYLNTTEHLKFESFTLSLTGINPDSKNYTPGKGKNVISKVQDVFGSGTESMGGDLDFTDEYDYKASLVSMSDTKDPDIVALKIEVKMSTFSLQVPYLSQRGSGEVITVKAATKEKPKRTHTYTGGKICMPTSTKMLFDYWDIKTSTGSDISRNTFMQRCWNDKSNPNILYPSPWQNWPHLRSVARDYVDESDANTYSVSDGPDSQEKEKEEIPSTYANNLLAELIQGRPVVKSTRATDGHVMVVRGAVVDNSGDVQWLILNDPNGNLASPDSVYDELDIMAPVGLRGKSDAIEMNLDDDVLGVREALQSLNYYSGSMTESVDETDPKDATVLAIKKLQGGTKSDGRVDPGGRAESKINKKLNRGTSNAYSKKENERNALEGENSDRGKHVYYSSSTEAKGLKSNHHFSLKLKAWTLVIERSEALTTKEIKAKLTPNKE